MKTWLIPISLCLLVRSAHADQCQVIDEPTARKAQSILRTTPTYLEYCEPCRDEAPGMPKRATVVAVRPSGDAKELELDGRPIDLAYIYVKTDDAHFANLAELAGCDATGVSSRLKIEAETATGVIISQGDPAPAPALVPVIPAVAEVVPPPVAPQLPPQVYVYSTTTREIAWLLPIALAATGGFLSGAALTALLFAARRRRAMRPRAAELGLSARA
jgi:hypothetical protein